MLPLRQKKSVLNDIYCTEIVRQTRNKYYFWHKEENIDAQPVSTLKHKFNRMQKRILNSRTGIWNIRKLAFPAEWTEMVKATDWKIPLDDIPPRRAK